MKDPEVMDPLQQDAVLEPVPDGPGVVVDPGSQLVCGQVRLHRASPLIELDRRRVSATPVAHTNRRVSRVNDIRRPTATLFRIHSEMIRFRLAELIADKAFKERRSISITEVAEGSGVHRATLSKMANQPGTNVGSDVIDKLCHYFQCQPGNVMSYIEDHNQ